MIHILSTQTVSSPTGIWSSDQLSGNDVTPASEWFLLQQMFGWRAAGCEETSHFLTSPLLNISSLPAPRPGHMTSSHS